jgi:hypothetical protein
MAHGIAGLPSEQFDLASRAATPNVEVAQQGLRECDRPREPPVERPGLRYRRHTVPVETAPHQAVVVERIQQGDRSSTHTSEPDWDTFVVQSSEDPVFADVELPPNRDGGHLLVDVKDVQLATLRAAAILAVGAATGPGR